jgi:hypothetical protein
MWKKLTFGFAVLIAVIACALWLVLAHLDGDVQAAIEQDGSAATGTRVTVGRVDLSLLRGICVISGLKVDNPPGFSTPFALKLGDITIHAGTKSLLAVVLAGSGLPGRSLLGNGPIMIQQVDIDSPHILYEVSGNGKGLNLTSLNLGVDSNLSALQRGAKNIAAQNRHQEQPLRQIITSLDVSGGKVSVFTSLLKGKLLSVKLSRIHLSGIGQASGGATTGQICGQVLTAIAAEAELEGAISLVKTVGTSATVPLGGALLNKLKSLF